MSNRQLTKEDKTKIKSDLSKYGIDEIDFSSDIESYKRLKDQERMKAKQRVFIVTLILFVITTALMLAFLEPWILLFALPISILCHTFIYYSFPYENQRI